MSTRSAARPSGLIDATFARPPLFHWLRRPLYWGSFDRLASALALADGERLLDVGCGTGICASLARGAYVGIDTALPYLRFARRRSAATRRDFIAMSAFDCAFADQAFDKAIVINMVHHLDESALDRLLVQLHRIVRIRVVLMDASPEIANPVERFLLRHDRGEHVRSAPDLRRLVERYFDVEREETFHNALHISPQILLALRPKPYTEQV